MICNNENCGSFTENDSTKQIVRWNAVVQLVRTLHYKPEGRGFDSCWGHQDFSLT